MRRSAPVLILLSLAITALSLGSTQIDNFWSALFNPGSNEILWEIRFPRVVAAITVGAALGIAGLLAQGACNNPLAEPAILGSTAGASLGAIIGILLGLVQVGSLGAVLFGSLGALLITALTFKLASLRDALSSFALILVGIAISALFASIGALLATMANRSDARSISFWSLGSLALVGNENLLGVLITTVIGAVIAWLIAPKLDQLSLGDQSAFNLGVDVKQLRLVALLALSLLAGGAVSTVGSIAFIGLAAPHIARLIYGPSHRLLVIESAFIGSVIVLLADTLARSALAPNEVPISLAAAILGAPILITLVVRRENIWRLK